MEQNFAFLCSVINMHGASFFFDNFECKPYFRKINLSFIIFCTFVHNPSVPSARLIQPFIELRRSLILDKSKGFSMLFLSNPAQI